MDEKGDGPVFGVFSAGTHELNLSTQYLGDLKMVNFKTIGYGGRDNNSLISALKEMNAEAVIDVRHKPYCGWNRDFCGEVLKDKLAAEGIDYLWISDLGNMTRDIILKMVDNKIYISCKIFESFMSTLGVYNDSDKVYY